MSLVVDLRSPEYSFYHSLPLALGHVQHPMISFAHLFRFVLGTLLACSLFGSLFAEVKVKGYYRKDGTYVQPHTRSSPNKTKNDNYSTLGNTNPSTGRAGTKPGDAVSPASVEAPPAKVETPIVSTFFAQISAGMSPDQVTALAGKPQMVRGAVWIYREGRVEFSANNAVSRVISSSIPPPSSAVPPTNAAPSQTAAPASQEKTFWVTNGSGIRHNSRCRYYFNSKGHAATQNEGRACKICGG